MKKILFKKGYYTVSEVKIGFKTKYEIDSGKTLHIPRFRKTVLNPYREVKNFDKLEEAKSYITKKLSKKRTQKRKVLKSLPTSIYLVLIKEESTNRTFVKVGITTKKFIKRRFSKKYGYEGYNVEKILRRVITTSRKAAETEKKILTELNNRSTQKYRPIIEHFSGYSECYDFISLNNITKVFDNIIRIQNL